MLSFPDPREAGGGDLVLALGVVRREARREGKRPGAHLAHLVAHGALHLAGDVGGVDVHLRRDAADVEARAAEDAVLDDRDVEVVEAVVDDGVARAGTDDDEIVMAHDVEANRRSTGAVASGR